MALVMSGTILERRTVTGEYGKCFGSIMFHMFIFQLGYGKIHSQLMVRPVKLDNSHTGSCSACMLHRPSKAGAYSLFLFACILG